MSYKWAKMPYRNYRISGADAISFLQGQLTQDLNVLDDKKCLYGAYCNHQGAMFANLLLAKNSSDDIILRMHESQSESVIKRLKMFVLRASVDIESLSNHHIGMNKITVNDFCNSIGVETPETFTVTRHDDFTIYALPGDYFELTTAKQSIIDGFSEKSEPSFSDIEVLRISSGNFHIYPETSELLLPQETPLEAWGGISYTKGCYVGQEIIARSKYRGKIRKGIAFAEINTTEEIQLSTEITTDDRSIGIVIDSCKFKNKVICMGSVNLSASIDNCLVTNHNTSFTLIN